MNEGRKRVIIENVKPEIGSGSFAIKRVVGEKIVVEADIFADGHDSVSAVLLYKKESDARWKDFAMSLTENDKWTGEFIVKELGVYLYSVEAWVDHFKSWRKALKKKFDAGQDLKIDLLIGVKYIEDTLKRVSLVGDRKKFLDFAELIKNTEDMEERVSIAVDEELGELMEKYSDKSFSTRYERELALIVERENALFSTWYERFPRSCSQGSDKHGTFGDLERVLPEIERMGFDILYLPPIHPIGKINRKGKNNSPVAEPNDVGSPWAIGSGEGGHKAIHPALGTFEDFERLINRAKSYRVEIAMDLAFQCTPDHPYVKKHPEWFRKRPDGTIQYAENPPKKYEDIIPIDFETDQWQELWEELKSVVLFWIEKGIRIFRVDNPHTKSFTFWHWLIGEIKRDYPDVIFLAEAFTRPKVMYHLAKIGFAQSYTYFTWRNTKGEFINYLTELTQTEVGEYFRPNFWPNTPDILPEHLQFGGRPVFMMRLVLAATLSSNYGIYGPAFELCVSDALTGREEYLNSEKYEIRQWDWDQRGNLKDFIATVNKIRKENPALQLTRNLRFYEADNQYLLFYGKTTEDLSNIILVVVNLDPYHTQSGWLSVPIAELGIVPNQPYLVHDLLSEDKFIWQAERNYVELNPQITPARIFRVRKRLKKETDFDYFI